jgi:SAM-dependent methyltransferase
MAELRYTEIRYLDAKRTVDDRALNRNVLGVFAELVKGLPAPPPRILELGAGLGNMVSRLADGTWIGDARYTLVDRDGEALRAAAVSSDADVELVESDVFAFLDGLLDGFLDGFLDGGGAGARAPFDAVIANAFLDLVDVPALLPMLWRAMRPGAPFWFSINFDGETVFLPELPEDGEVFALYHRTMDQRVRDGRRAGESRTGRHLLEQLPRGGATLAAAGSSDWVVFAAADRRYPADEAYFLHHIVHTIDVALAAPRFEPWIAARHAQIERGQLIYIAHQLDIAGRAPA